MMEAEAWKALSPEAVYVFLEMKREHRGRSENRFSLPYAEIRKRKLIHRAKISLSILELEAFGFIDRPVKGGLHKEANVYALSERWKQISKDSEKMADAKTRINTWTENRRAKNRNTLYLATYKAVRTHEPVERKKESLLVRTHEPTGTDACTRQVRTHEPDRYGRMNLSSKDKKTEKKAVKRSLKSPEGEIEKATVSIKRRLRNSIALLEREGHG
jgi:hypothetical protein